MNLKPVFAAAVTALSALSGLSANAATADLSGYTLSYDDTTRFTGVDFTFGDGTNEGFGWNVASTVGVVSAAQGLQTATFALPSFTVTAKAAFTLSASPAPSATWCSTRSAPVPAPAPQRQATWRSMAYRLVGLAVH